VVAYNRSSSGHHRSLEGGRLHIDNRPALAGILFSPQDWNALGVPAPERGCGLANRGKRGSKHHLLVDERGLLPVAQISGGQIYDSRFLTLL
jgi:hypothetical protein